jgi:exodeoxyribonuclease VII small subunit
LQLPVFLLIFLAKAAAMTTPNDSLTYDQAFAELEAVLAALESGDQPLEQTLALYEQGVALANLCARKLADAELRVRQWQGPDAPGDQTKTFEGWQDN